MGRESSEKITSLEGIDNVPEKWVPFFELAFKIGSSVTIEGWGNSGCWQEWLALDGQLMCELSCWDGDDLNPDD